MITTVSYSESWLDPLTGRTVTVRADVTLDYLQSPDDALRDARAFALEAIATLSVERTE